MKKIFLRIIALLLSIGIFSTQADEKTYKGHAIAMYGDIKYGPKFTHFEYVNPTAPKGGEVRLASIGTFDNLNPFILKGISAAGLGQIYDSLLESSLDEPFTEYGLLVETIEMPEDRSWVTFTLRNEAHWHDGVPITIDDVLFSFETLRTKGHPFYRSYYADVLTAKKVGKGKVKFTFEKKDNRELPLIMGQLTILPKHYWKNRSFEETTLDPPLGSGPYKIESVDPGRSITYKRVKNYWGKSLPINYGKNNFDQIQFDYYRDANVAIEALKSQEFDWRSENSSKDWATSYDIPSADEGRLIKELVPHEKGTGMQGFWFNTRRGKFADPKVRKALAYAFDFEWTNANLFYGQYVRTQSYFSNTELASSGLPKGKEREILQQYRGRIPDKLFTHTYNPPSNDSSGNIRKNLRIARNLLNKTEWTINNQKLISAETGEEMKIEFLLVSPNFERIVGPMIQNLKRLGIEAKMRTVDSAQYQNRLQEFDFDIIVGTIRQSLSPGNEQRDFWTTAAAEINGSRNYAGIKDPVVDELVDLVITAPDRENLISRTRALDRILLWGHYVIPHWHIRSYRLIYWNIFGKPKTSPKYGLGFPNTWWIDKEKLSLLKQEK